MDNSNKNNKTSKKQCLDDYKFIKILRNMKGSYSKIFLLEKDDIKYLCKRCKNKEFRMNEVSFPKEINSKRIVEIVDHFNEDGYDYIIMPYYEGCQDIFTMLSSGTFNDDYLTPIFIDMALAIKDCHDKDICHLDIKAENYVKYKDRIFLIDFGFAMKDGEKIDEVVGTDTYIAPEMEDDCEFSKASDVFSFGCMMFFYLTNGEDLVDDICKRTNWKRVFSGLRISQKMKNIIIGCCQFNPKRRFNIDHVIDLLK